jgi:hypothetical protein
MLKRDLFVALAVALNRTPCMAIITIVDYLMGEAAQTLNGYEILRRTFWEPISATGTLSPERMSDEA